MVKKIEQEKKSILKNKMKLELYVAEIVYDHNIKTDATWLKMRKINRYAIEKVICVHYEFGAIIILVVIMISMLLYLDALDKLDCMVGL